MKLSRALHCKTFQDYLGKNLIKKKIRRDLRESRQAEFLILDITRILFWMRITYCRKKRVKPYMGNKKEMCDKNYKRTSKRQRWREVSPFGPCRVIWTTFSRKKSVIRVSNNLHVRFRRLSIYL